MILVVFLCFPLGSTMKKRNIKRAVLRFCNCHLNRNGLLYRCDFDECFLLKSCYSPTSIENICSVYLSLLFRHPQFIVILGMRTRQWNSTEPCRWSISRGKHSTYSTQYNSTGSGRWSISRGKHSTYSTQYNSTGQADEAFQEVNTELYRTQYNSTGQADEAFQEVNTLLYCTQYNSTGFRQMKLFKR